MASASGSVSPGRWWSVMTTPMPAALAVATPSTLAMPLSTVMMMSGLLLRWVTARSTTAGDRP